MAAGSSTVGPPTKRDGQGLVPPVPPPRARPCQIGLALRHGRRDGRRPRPPAQDDRSTCGWVLWRASQRGSRAGPARGGTGGQDGTPICAARALHALTRAVDVQPEAADLGFRISLSAGLAEGVSPGLPRFRSRLNAGVVRVAGANMAVSGNLVLVAAASGVLAAAVRLLIWTRRWDQDWDYKHGGLDAAAPGSSACTPRPDGRSVA